MHFTFNYRENTLGSTTHFIQFLLKYPKIIDLIFLENVFQCYENNQILKIYYFTI